MKNKLRSLGSILLDIEPLVLEMTDGHDLEHGDILNLIRGYLEVHCPGSREQYVGGGQPTFYYGPGKEDLK